MKGLTKYRPSRMLTDLQGEVDRLFADFLAPMQEEEGSTGLDLWRPRTDLSETDESYKIRLDLPGVDKDDIQVDLQNHTLTIRGERKDVAEEEDERFHRIEKRYGSFSRSFTLPDVDEGGKAEAQFENGVLTVTIPRTEAAGPRRIDVE